MEELSDPDTYERMYGVTLDHVLSLHMSFMTRIGMHVDRENIPHNVGRRLSTHKYHKMVGDDPDYKVRPVIACNGVVEAEMSENFAAALDFINEGEDSYWMELWKHVPGAGLVFPWRLRGIEELHFVH